MSKIRICDRCNSWIPEHKKFYRIKVTPIIDEKEGAYAAGTGELSIVDLCAECYGKAVLHIKRQGGPKNDLNPNRSNS